MMAKDYSSKLRKIIRRTQHTRFRFDGKIKGESRVMILEDKVIWTDENILIVNDPTLIKSIGGDYIIQNYLKKAPTSYDLQVIDNSIQITGESIWERGYEGVREFLKTPKLNFLPTTPQEFEKLRHEGRGIPYSKDFKDKLDYIQKTFSDKKLKTLYMNNFLLYFLEDGKVRAVLG